MPETEWVRVLDKDTGHKRSVRPPELPHGNYEVLKEPAVDSRGDVLGPEFAVAATASLDDLKLDDLKDEIGRRNAARDPEGDDYIQPSGTKKADLVAALKADEQRAANTPGGSDA